jgi:hypothetical protein
MSAEDRGGREEVEDEVEDEETAEGVRVVAAAGLARMRESCASTGNNKVQL